jgi:LacI family transcriptional regulator
MAVGKRLKVERKVTMADVAKAAHCSQATVSLVLNNVTDVKISAELRRRVIEAARTLGYGGSPLIRRPALSGLVGGSIGFLVDQLGTTPEAIHAIDGATEEIIGDNVTLLVSQTLGNPAQEERALQHMLRSGVQGVIYFSVFTRMVDARPTLLELPVPVVLLNCYTSANVWPAIVPDEAAGGYRATRHLIERGHSQIATIVGERFMEAAIDRLNGYRRALNEAGIAYDKSMVVDGDWTMSSGYDATRRLLTLADRPTAIFCQNDKMAMGCYAAAKEAGLTIGDDLSIVGYDDDEISRHLQPQLTTLDLPHRAMGAWAARKMTDIVSGSSGNNEPVKLECTLIERMSVGARA